MDPQEAIQERIAVIASYKVKDARSLCYPAKMRWGQKEVVFTALGLRHETRKGARMVHIFDMSDGANDYRLEFDAETLAWTLISITKGEHRATA